MWSEIVVTAVRHFRNRERDWRQNVSRKCFYLTTRQSAIRYFFSLSPVAVSEAFGKVNSAKFPSCFLSGESKKFSSLHQTIFAISKEYVLLAFQNSLQSAKYQYSGLYSQLFEA